MARAVGGALNAAILGLEASGDAREKSEDVAFDVGRGGGGGFSTLLYRRKDHLGLTPTKFLKLIGPLLRAGRVGSNRKKDQRRLHLAGLGKLGELSNPILELAQDVGVLLSISNDNKRLPPQ